MQERKGYKKQAGLILFLMMSFIIICLSIFVTKEYLRRHLDILREGTHEISSLETNGREQRLLPNEGEKVELYNVYMLINELEVESDISMAGSKVSFSSESSLTLSYYHPLTDQEIEADEEGNISIPENGLKLKIDGITMGSEYEITIQSKGAPEGYESKFHTATITIDAKTEGEITCYVKEFTKTVEEEEVTVEGSEEDTAVFMYEETDGKVKLYGNEDLEIYYFVADKNGKTEAELAEVEWQAYNKEAGVAVEKNGIVYTKSKYKTGAYSRITSLNINNIDKLVPTVEVLSITEKDTRDEATLKFSIQDQEETQDYGKSGISGYALTKREEEPTEFITASEGEITISEITDNGTYYVWVRDKAGNVSHETVNVSVITYVSENIVAIILGAPDSSLVGTEYQTLASLFAALDEKNITKDAGQVVIQMVGNVKNEGTKINDKNIVLDLNGYTVTNRMQESTFDVQDGTLKIVDDKYDIADYIEDETLATTLKTKYAANEDYGKISNPNYIALEVRTAGTLTLGQDNSTGFNNIEYPNHNSPIIEGNIKGVVNYRGTFNYYDGVIYGQTTIDGSISDTPLLYDPTVIDMETGTFRATLEIVANVEAMIGKTRYARIENAIEAANDIKGTPDDQIEIDIVNDISKNIMLELDETKNIKLDLNGFTLTNNTSDYAIKNNGKLEIIDSALEDVINQAENMQIIGELTNNGTYYFVENENGQLIPTNGKAYQVSQGGTTGIKSVTANSYITIDLTKLSGYFYIIINATISSETSDYGYATITQSKSAPSYNSSTGRFMYISGAKESTDYTSSTLTGGKIYYLHLGYRKDGSTDTNEDQVVINSIGLYESDQMAMVSTYVEKGFNTRAVNVYNKLTADYGTIWSSVSGVIYNDINGNLLINSGVLKATRASGAQVIKNLGKVTFNNGKITGTQYGIFNQTRYTKEEIINSGTNCTDEVLSEIINGDEEYYFEKIGNQYVSNNQEKKGTTAKSYFEIDLRDKEGYFVVNVNAKPTTRKFLWICLCNDQER